MLSRGPAFAASLWPSTLRDTSNDVLIPMADARDGRRGDRRKDQPVQVKGRPSDVLRRRSQNEES